MDHIEVADYITSTFEHVEVTEAYGYTFFFYRDERMMRSHGSVSSRPVTRPSSGR